MKKKVNKDIGCYTGCQRGIVRALAILAWRLPTIPPSGQQLSCALFEEINACRRQSMDVRRSTLAGSQKRYKRSSKTKKKKVPLHNRRRLTVHGRFEGGGGTQSWLEGGGGDFPVLDWVTSTPHQQELGQYFGQDTAVTGLGVTPLPCGETDTCENITSHRTSYASSIKYSASAKVTYVVVGHICPAGQSVHITTATPEYWPGSQATLAVGSVTSGQA